MTIRASATLIAALCLPGAPPLPPVPHPLHTTVAEVITVPEGIWITVRGFADDLATAASRRAAGPVRPGALDSLVGEYVRATFHLTGSDGRAVPLRPAGVRRAGEVVWVDLAGPRQRLAGLRLRSAVLCELFPDQVNIVQVRGARGRQSMVFTPGSVPRAIR